MMRSKMIKTKFLIFTLLFSIFITTGVYASESVITTNPNTNVLDTNNEVSPYFMYTYSKTVVKYYTSINSVPESITYSEYLTGYGWCYGTLHLQKVVKSGSGYNATFTGTMYAPNQ